jgi:hypothetical protein
MRVMHAMSVLTQRNATQRTAAQRTATQRIGAHRSASQRRFGNSQKQH